MTTKKPENILDPDVMTRNLERIEVLSQRLVTAFSNKKQSDSALQGPGSDFYAKSVNAYWAEMLENPTRIMEQQVAYWGDTMRHFVQAQQDMAAGIVAEAETGGAADKRFSNPMWQAHPYFKYAKQQYETTAKTIETSLEGLQGLNTQERKRVSYFSRQIIDLFSPSNFLATNPDALFHAVETEGQSLVDGLENLVRDLEDNGGELLVSLTDKGAFELGKNIATTKGSVVFRNDLFELIQYAPVGDTAYEIPLIIFPPWINKFYILDLKPENSLIKWITEQGFTLFVVSWVNPDATHHDVGLDSYVENGFLQAISEVKKICDVPQVNTVGYCIAGATLALSLALLKSREDDSVKSATFFTTLTDFSDQGEIGVFLDDDFVDGIEREVADKGVMPAHILSRTFSFMRANDLIYGPAIRSYMMGKSPPAFDLLYWNGDGTNLPAHMAMDYLRKLCQQNQFCEGGYKMAGETLKVNDVQVPVCAIACETDHIAAWKSSFDGVRQFGSTDKTFILSQSGHVAGIVNPPSKKKYGHYTNAAQDLSAGDWYETAQFQDGSWWPRWGAWLAQHSGAERAARSAGGPAHPVICAAPGTYVRRAAEK